MVPVNPQDLVDIADRCVKCGLCLPHCPTYLLFRNEAESPRGRIALIQGLLAGALEAGPPLLDHLDHCLLCRNCERACPSQVEYSKLIDGTRSHLARDKRPGWELSVLSNARLLSRLVPLGAIAEKTGAARILPKKQARMAGLAVRARADSNAEVPELGRNAGRMALFGGCVTSVTDRGVLIAARTILQALGYEVVEAPGPVCCGAMHQHAGFSNEAEKRLKRSSDVLSALSVDAVLTVASGCGAQLVEHAGLDVPVRDVSAFLADAHWAEESLGRMKGQRVGLHQPCSLRNGMREDAAVCRLLSRFDDLEVMPLQESGCCGAAGMHLIEHPDMARKLAFAVLEQIRAIEVQTVLTSNTGCGLHLGAELDRAGLPVKVRHPVEYLLDHLGIAEGDPS